MQVMVWHLLAMQQLSDGCMDMPWKHCSSATPASAEWPAHDSWCTLLTVYQTFCTGRFFDGRLYDVLELGVDKYTSIRDFGRAAEVQIGNKVWVAAAQALIVGTICDS